MDMSKNEIVAKWMGYLIGRLSGWLSGTSQIEYSYLKEDGVVIKAVRVDKLKYDSSYDWLMPAWTKFRDLKFTTAKLTEQHEILCEDIEIVITRRPITEAFDELVKGIEWYESLKP